MADAYRNLSDKEQAILKLPVFFDSYDNFYHPIRESVTNARDILVETESENGLIEVTLHDDNRTITIKDNGCGIILDGESNGKPNWEHAFLILFSGSKMSTGKTSGGTNGCGNTIINYSSDLMDITSKRNGKIYHIQFINGGEISIPFECLGDTEEHGTEITFKLCDKIYTNTVFNENEARGIVERIVVTSPNITSIFKYKDQTYTFNFENLSEYLTFKRIDRKIHDIIFNEKVFESEYYDIDKQRNEIEKTKINLIANSSKEQNIHYPFLNGIYMPQLEENTVHKGVINGFKDSINKYLKDNDMYDKGEKSITVKDVEESISYICSIESTNVSYTSQTKFSTKKELYESTVKTYIKDFMESYSIENKDDMNELAKAILINKRAREKSEEVRQKTKSKLNNEIKFTDDIKNFKNCISKDKTITELFLGEGSSAQGGLLQSRDSKFQACFHVGGKMLSLLKATEKKIFANDVVYNLYRVFGCGTDLYKSKYNVKRSKTEPPLPPFNKENFRWSKVILSTDQDIDAYQIRCLILTCVYRMSKELIEDGYFYIAEAPLFEITTKEKEERTLYAYTDNEKDDILRDLDSQGIKYYPPERNKGLGQMDKDTRAKTMMIPETRRLTKITVQDVEEMARIIDLWMGDNIENRKNVITNNFNYIEHFDLENEKDVCKIFHENYLPYAIDIVKDRAIIGIDGFKPSHRKLLWTLEEKKLYGHRSKSANIVGDNMYYNVHGDGSIYDTLVRMAQEDTLLYPYVNGKGNFGLHTHNGKDLQEAHMRYTDAGASDINKELFKDIYKNAVPFMDNYDGQKKEPVLLPTTFPNLLVNYNEGIAVGMASKTPSFNLNEVCDLTEAYIKDKTIEVTDYLLSPDLATGGEVLYDKDNLKQIYATGNGSVTLNAKYIIQDENTIVIKEIPYSTNVDAIISAIKDLCLTNDNNYKCITDVLDTTERAGMSITIEVKNNTNIKNLMRLLFKNTPLQSKLSFNMNIICLDGIPKVLGIKQILEEWLTFRIRCIKNSTNYDIENKSKELHLLKGLEKILLNTEQVIDLMKNSSDIISDLKQQFELDDLQAKYIYEMKLRYINKEHISNEIKVIQDLENEVNDLQDLFNNEDRILNIIIEQLHNVKKKFGKPRKTEIVYEDITKSIKQEDLIEEFTTTLILSEQGYFKKTRKYSDTQKLKDGDEIKTIVQCSNKDKAIFISNQGNAYFLNLWEQNEKTPSALGEYLPNLLPLEKDETIIGMLTTNQYKGEAVIVYEDGHLVIIPLTSYATKQNATRLKNSLAKKLGSPVLITQITEDTDIELTDNFGKTKIVNTSGVNRKDSRSAQGITAWTSKKQGWSLISAKVVK